MNHSCEFSKTKAQNILEQKVMEQLSPMMEKYIYDIEFSAKKEKPKVDTKKIQAELDRLNNMYLKGRISEDDYDMKYTELNNKLKTNVDAPKTVSPALKNLMNVNLLELYKGFTVNEKQLFMRSIIKEIKVDEDYNITDIIFL